MKKFILGLIFNKRQREVIWQAVLFSAHTYFRRGNPAKADEVHQVINEVGEAFGVKETYTKSEVDSLLADAVKELGKKAEKAINRAHNDGFHCGFNKAFEAMIKGELKVREIDVEVKGDENAAGDAHETADEEGTHNENEGNEQAAETPEEEQADNGSQETAEGKE